MIRYLAILGLAGCLPTLLLAEEATPKLYTEGKFGKGELKYIDGVPVLIVEGSPDEIGEQFAELAVKPAKHLVGKLKEFSKSIGAEAIFPFLLKGASGMIRQFPEHHQKELEAMAKKSEIDRQLLIFANCVPDLAKVGGCSTLVIEPSRSKTKGTIFGRNLDWPPFENLPDYTLVTIFRSKDKFACATITVPPVLGCISGMNEKGLSITINQITKSKDQAPTYHATGMPMLLLYRKILEECSTIDEAEKLLNSVERTTYSAVTIADTKGGAVFELTPKNVVRRNSVENVCCCTNHFLSDKLAVKQGCWRLPVLEKIQKGNDTLGVEDVAKALDRVNQNIWTFQTMIFEPESRTLHLAYSSKQSATKLPLKKLELGKLFK